jgi:hypothetical protein
MTSEAGAGSCVAQEKEKSRKSKQQVLERLGMTENELGTLDGAAPPPGLRDLLLAGPWQALRESWRVSIGTT